MANLTILRSYATKLPSSLPPSVLFSHTDTTLTIYDAFPKSIFHFLILPRVQTDSPLDLSSLKSLLKRDKTRAKEVVERSERGCGGVAEGYRGRDGQAVRFQVGGYGLGFMLRLRWSECLNPGLL